MHSPKVVSREEWLVARKTHLKNEKALTRMRDLVAAERRTLPWVKVDKAYTFEGPHGKRTLAELFDGRSQLAIYHFMWRWDLDAGCPSCSFLADHFDGANLHLAHHDVSLVVVSRAPPAKFAPYMKRMGWRFNWVSSHGSDFNFDYHVSFAKDDLAKGSIDYNYQTIEDEKYFSDELPGLSVFYKDEKGDVLSPSACSTKSSPAFWAVEPRMSPDLPLAGAHTGYVHREGIIPCPASIGCAPPFQSRHCQRGTARGRLSDKACPPGPDRGALTSAR